MEQMRASERRGRPPSPPQPVGRNGVVSFVNAAQVHHRNALRASISWGHEDLVRWQIHNTFLFGQGWFSSLGWRRDELVSDGVEVVESGLYFDIGKWF